MKTITILLCTLCLHATLFAQTLGVRSSRTLGGPSYEKGNTILPTNDGGYIAAGQSNGEGGDVSGHHGREDIWVVKTGPTGAVEWQKSLGGDSSDLFRTILQNQDGSFIVFGVTYSREGDVTRNRGSSDLWMVKLSASGSIIWDRSFGGTKMEELRWVDRTADNGWILAGYTSSNDGDVVGYHGGEDVWVVKLSPTGSIQWQKCLGGAGIERPRFIMPMADGDYVMVGSTASANGDVTNLHGGNDLWVVRLSATGTVVWKKAYGGTSHETGYRAVVANDGNLVVLANVSSTDGDVTSFYHGGYDTWVVKISYTDGALLWEKCVGGLQEERPVALLKDGEGNYLVASNSYSKDGDAATGHGLYLPDVLLTRLDDAGTTLWTRCYGGYRTEEVRDIYHHAAAQKFLLAATTASGDGDVVTGYHPPVAGQDSSTVDAWVVQIDYSGTIEWQRCLGGSRNDYVYHVQQTSPSEFLLAGETESSDGDIKHFNGSTDMWVVRLGAVNVVKGVLFLDNNRNGVKDTGEPYFSDGMVTTAKADDTVSSVPVNGLFINEVGIGNYTTEVAFSLPYYTAVPPSQGSSFSTYYNTDSFSLAVQPLANKKDLVVSLVPLTPARPGFNATYRLLYKNVGTTTLPSGEVVLRKDSRLSLVNAVPAASTSAGDQLTWTYSDLKPFDTASILVELRVLAPPVVNIGDTLTSRVLITPSTGDETPGDNSAYLKQVVVGSYDPNDKAESNGGRVEQAFISEGQYLTYTIRFQNMGTDTAFTVTVKDTLDNRLDWSTLQVVGSSHAAYQLRIEDGHILSWVFPDIDLPAVVTDEPGSHGYVVYRVKPLGTVSVGETIHNTASIYFDYNLPVKTNDATTTVAANATPPQVTISATPSGPVCSGTPVTFTATVTPAGTSGTFQWKVNGVSAGTNTTTYTTTSLHEGDAVSVGFTTTTSGESVSVSSNSIIASIITVPTPTVSAGGTTTFCQGGSVVLTSSATAGNQWYRDGAAINGATAPTYTATAGGMYTVTATANGCSSQTSAGVTVTVNALPAVPTISVSGNVLTSSAATGNQWFKDGVAIDGATAQTYTATASGVYSVQVTQGGCSSTSEAFNFVATGIIGPAAWNGEVSAYPNPVANELHLRNTGARKLHLVMVDDSGRKIYERTVDATSVVIPMEGLAGGVYRLLITDRVKKETIILPVVKQ